MTRHWISALCIAASLSAQGPIDPTDCSRTGIYLGNNPDCEGIPRSWQWPLPPDACYRASVLGILGERELIPAVRPFSFVTGHTDPATGREFALLSAWNGLVIVDAHDVSENGPTRIVPNYWFLPDAISAVHRGTASFGEYVYESNSFRPSIRVTRVMVNSTSLSVSIATLPDVPLPAIGTSYRLTVDKERGHLYVPTINGLFIYDVNGVNGAAPQLLAVWKGWLTGGGIIASFDVHLQRYPGGITRAIVSEYLSSGTTHIAILDVTNLPSGAPAANPWTPANWCAFPASVPGAGNAHSAWMTPDGNHLYSSIGDVATVVYDMQSFGLYNANALLTIAQIPPRVQQAGSNPPTALVYPELPMRHMGLQGLGHTGYVSSWQEGFILYDVRPGNLDPHTVLAQVDTSFASSTTAFGGPTWNLLYPGAFSVYRLQDSGVIYIGDEYNGLFMIRPNVGHMNRFGQGTAELHNGGWLTPRITAEHAPPRQHTAAAPDADQRVTISGVVPGRALMVIAATDGLPTGVPYPAPSSSCLNYMGGLVAAPIFITADGSGAAEILLPPVLPAQFRLFMQAFSFVPGSVTCSASSRGTWFGLAEPR